LTTLEGIVVLLNEGASGLFGCKEDKVVGSYIEAFIGVCVHDLISTADKVGRRAVSLERELGRLQVFVWISLVNLKKGNSAAFQGYRIVLEDAYALTKQQESLDIPRIYVSPDGFVLDIDVGVAKLFGRLPDDIRGSDIRSLVGACACGASDVWASLKSAGPGESLLKAQAEQKGVLWLGISVAKFVGKERPCYEVAVRDRTEEAELLQSEIEADQRQIGIVLDSVPSAILSTDQAGVITYVNSSTCDMLGMAATDLVGSGIATVMYEDGGAIDPEGLFHKLLGGMTKLVAKRRDGSTFPVRISLSSCTTKTRSCHTVVMVDTTSEADDHRRLEAEQQKMKAIMDGALNAIITTDDLGYIQMLNKSSCKVFRLEQQSAIGMSLAELLEQKDGTQPEPEDIPVILSALVGKVQELRGRRSDGYSFPMRMSVSQVDLGDSKLYTAILRDVTQEKRDQEKIMSAQEMISLERAKLQALLDTTLEAFIVTSSSGLIQSWNKAAERIFLHKAEEVIGRNVSILMPRSIAKRHNEYIRRYVEEGAGAHVMGSAREVTAVRKDGSKFSCMISISDTVIQGEHLFTVTIRDISNELLLMNMLPTSIAARLRAGESPINDGHEDVGILFADIVGFTSMSSKLSPFEVVSFLNDIFNVFDGLVETYNLEKIKTIGDCYMVVSGIPDNPENHTVRLGCFALEMSHALTKYNEENCPKYPLNMRIGVHCGPVIAGVVGKIKFLYDIWGDAVNTASRMESTGIAGSIQVSDAFMQRTKKWFLYRDRGMVEVKGKGQMHTWILEGLMPEQLVNLRMALSKQRETSARASIDLSGVELPRSSFGSNSSSNQLGMGDYVKGALEDLFDDDAEDSNAELLRTLSSLTAPTSDLDTAGNIGARMKTNSNFALGVKHTKKSRQPVGCNPLKLLTRSRVAPDKTVNGSNSTSAFSRHGESKCLIM